MRTVGVQGDCRTYSHLVGVTHATYVASDDIAAASVFGSTDALVRALDWPALIEAAKEITRRVDSVNRVCYIFAPPSTTVKTTPVAMSAVRCERSITCTRLTPDNLALLRRADAIVNNALFRHKLMRKLSQVPVLLLPCDFGVTGARSIGLRPFITNDFMTGVPAVPGGYG